MTSTSLMKASIPTDPVRGFGQSAPAVGSTSESPGANGTIVTEEVTHDGLKLVGKEVAKSTASAQHTAVGDDVQQIVDALVHERDTCRAPVDGEGVNSPTTQASGRDAAPLGVGERLAGLIDRPSHDGAVGRGDGEEEGQRHDGNKGTLHVGTCVVGGVVGEIEDVLSPLALGLIHFGQITPPRTHQS